MFKRIALLVLMLLSFAFSASAQELPDFLETLAAWRPVGLKSDHANVTYALYVSGADSAEVYYENDSGDAFMGFATFEGTVLYWTPDSPGVQRLPRESFYLISAAVREDYMALWQLAESIHTLTVVSDIINKRLIPLPLMPN